MTAGFSYNNISLVKITKPTLTLGIEYLKV